MKRHCLFLIIFILYQSICIAQIGQPLKYKKAHIGIDYGIASEREEDVFWKVRADRKDINVYEKSDLRKLSKNKVKPLGEYVVWNENDLAIEIGIINSKDRLGWVSKSEMLLWEQPLINPKFGNKVLAISKANKPKIYSNYLNVSLTPFNLDQSENNIFYVYKTEKEASLISPGLYNSSNLFWVPNDEIVIIENPTFIRKNSNSNLPNIPIYKSVNGFLNNDISEKIADSKMFNDAYPLIKNNKENGYFEIYYHSNNEILRGFITNDPEISVINHLLINDLLSDLRVKFEYLSQSMNPLEILDDIIRNGSNLNGNFQEDFIRYTLNFSLDHHQLNQVSTKTKCFKFIDDNSYNSIIDELKFKSFQLDSIESRPSFVSDGNEYHYVQLKNLPLGLLSVEVSCQLKDISDVDVNILYLETPSEALGKTFQDKFIEMKETWKNNSNTYFIYHCKVGNVTDEVCFGSSINEYQTALNKMMADDNPPIVDSDKIITIKQVFREKIIYADRLPDQIRNLKLYLMVHTDFLKNSDPLDYNFGEDYILKDLSEEIFHETNPERLQISIYVDPSEKFRFEYFKNNSRIKIIANPWNE